MHKYLLVSVFFIGLTGCGGSSSEEEVITPEPTPAPEVTPPIVESNIKEWWDTTTPDFSENPDRPVITLIDNHTLYLPVGANYQEVGATAVDKQDGDISGQIVITSNLNVNLADDYFVRYSVKDSDDITAIEAVRIVRVVDDKPQKLTSRPVGNSYSHLGYIEHLPENYGENPDQLYPLFIFNHGNGSNAVISGDDPLKSLLQIGRFDGLPQLVNSNNWDENDSFVALAPQLGHPGQNDPIERIDAFIDFAIATYKIDPERVYVTGWSQGAFMTYYYAQKHPDKVAAIVPISGGMYLEDMVAEEYCSLESVPIWAFHGADDAVVISQRDIDTIGNLQQNCNNIVLPKITIYQERDHFYVYHGTFDLTHLANGSEDIISDPAYDLYDQNIYSWLLSHSKSRE